eukprot:187951-Pleurochrysis_carterae.AAC.1
MLRDRASTAIGASGEAGIRRSADQGVREDVRRVRYEPFEDAQGRVRVSICSVSRAQLSSGCGDQAVPTAPGDGA